LPTPYPVKKYDFPFPCPVPFGANIRETGRLKKKGVENIFWERLWQKIPNTLRFILL
jgi:hypothetical protein